MLKTKDLATKQGLTLSLAHGKIIQVNQAGQIAKSGDKLLSLANQGNIKLFPKTA